MTKGAGKPLLNDTIAVVIPHYEGLFYSYYALEVMRGVGIACDALGLDMLVHIVGQDKKTIKVNAGGLIFADVISQKHILAKMVEKGVPCVVINHIVDDLPVDCIAIDNRMGAKEAVEYLISLGHTKIAHITGDLKTQAAAERLVGYKEALLKSGLPLVAEYIQQADYSRLSARMALEKLLRITDMPTAVFVASDEMALECISVIREHGLSVPGDISVVGFDDSPYARQSVVPLTTVKQPILEMSREAVEELYRIIQNKAGKEVYIHNVAAHKILWHTELIIRNSCQPPLR